MRCMVDGEAGYLVAQMRRGVLPYCVLAMLRDNDRYGFEEGAQLLDKILTEKGFRHEFALRPGNHGWSYLSQYMKYALLFHWQSFEQLTPAAHPGVKSGAH